MTSLLESYRILGVSVGADLATVTTSYKQLCRTYHPDINDNPEAEELMKQVNIAYTALREKFKREAAFRDRTAGVRPVRRYAPDRPRTEQSATWKTTQDPQKQATEDYHRKAAEQATISAEAETDSRKVLHAYFKALNTYDYKKAYEYLCNYDKSNITQDEFVKWRESVAKLYPMREFKISPHSSIAVVTWGGSKIFHARKFKVVVTEDSDKESKGHSDEHDKLVITEYGQWRVFLGYKEISGLTRAFEDRFKTKQKRDIERRWEEFSAGINTEYDMYTMSGMKKAMSKELYRQRRYGSPVTFAAISVSLADGKDAGLSELLRSAAKTIRSSLRELDLAAYAGDGVFTVLFVELGKRNAKNTVSRLAEAIKNNAEPGLSDNAKIEYHFDAWSENRYADFEEVNNVLKRFGKYF